MDEAELFETQADMGGAAGVETDLVGELSAVGLEDAVEIGRGGFGIVYRCTQTVLDRTVAVKVLTVDLDENRARFLREQKAMGRLTGHPNIVAVLEVGETPDGHPFLVMPYHQQGSLEARIRRLGPRPFDEVLRIGVRMASALDAAHRLHILHRDVKPANILLTDYGEPMLCDFGIAHITGGFKTATGLITGSPAFTAPEVLSGEVATEAADVYGLGSTLFCALTGHAAFERRSGEQLVTQFLRITSEPAPDLREHGIPEEVSAVIETAMSRKPEDRPSPVALGARLRQIQVHLGCSADRMIQPADTPEPPAVALVPAQSGGLARGDTRSLTLQLTSFVGRRKLLSELENALSKSRLVTLTGIGGVGKTRLALQAADRVGQNFADGTRVVEFGELRDETVLVDMVASAVGVPNRVGTATTQEVLVDHLSTREFLLMLNNCEHVVVPVAQLVESLLRSCPRLVVLATSRETLGIGGESVLRVGPLEFPDPATELSLRELAKYDAVRLFTERGAAAAPGFKLTEGNRLCVAQICARLEGLPLAIELAAARLRVMSADQILQRLDDRFALLTHGDRGGPIRQQTLQWCIDWSYNLCTPDEQLLWAKLSVFAGGFELDAVEGVCCDGPAGPELVDALSALVDKSLLIREVSSGAAVRFRMLETVRDYGRKVLEESGADSDLYRRHRDWYERWVFEAEADWISGHQLERVSRLKRELPNLRQILEFDLREKGGHGLRMVAVLYPLWLLGGRLSEGRTWIERMMGGSPGSSGLDRAKALYSATSLAVSQGNLPAAARSASGLRELADEEAGPMIAAFAAAADGLTSFVDGDLVGAIAEMDKAVEVLDAANELVWRVSVLLWLGFACDLQGDSDRALTRYEEVLAITESHEETTFRSWALWQMGIVLWRRGEFDRAAQSLFDGLRLTQRIGDPLVSAFILEVLAWIAGEQHDAQRAAVLMGAAEALGRAAGSSAVPFPNLLAYHEICTRRAHEALGTEPFETARHEGGSLNLDSAVGFALGEPQPAARRRRGRR